MILNSSDFTISAFDSSVFLCIWECVLSYSWTPIRASRHKLRSNLNNSKFSKRRLYQHQSYMKFFVYNLPVYPYHFQLILHFLFLKFSCFLSKLCLYSIKRIFYMKFMNYLQTLFEFSWAYSGFSNSWQWFLWTGISRR